MEWKTIDSHPKDGTVILYHKNWDVCHKAEWKWFEEPDEDGNGGILLWHLEKEDGGAMGDGLLWPDEDYMPTHYCLPPLDIEE